VSKQLRVFSSLHPNQTLCGFAAKTLTADFNTRIASIHNALVIAMKVKKPTRLKKPLPNSQAGGGVKPFNKRNGISSSRSFRWDRVQVRRDSVKGPCSLHQSRGKANNRRDFHAGDSRFFELVLRMMCSKQVSSTSNVSSPINLK
jgi:hypothetical protein